MSIEVSGVTKYYGSQKALHNVSFTVNDGDVVGFLGPNGAGKSTMMKIITGFLPANTGSVKVCDYDVATDPIKVKRLIGYLPEHNPLYLDMYMREYLNFVANIFNVIAKKEAIDRVIELTGLQNGLGKKIGQLSKGFRQRVGIAQALIHDPKVLILDEPTSGLDPNQLVEIRELIVTLGKTKTILLSTHIMQEVETVCDRYIIINNGELAANYGASESMPVSSCIEKTVLVEFGQTVDRGSIYKIPNLENAKELEGNKWILTSPNDIDLRPEVFHFAVKNGYTVLSMQEKTQSLEETFIELTKKK